MSREREATGIHRRNPRIRKKSKMEVSFWLNTSERSNKKRTRKFPWQSQWEDHWWLEPALYPGSKEDTSQTPTEVKDKNHELWWFLKGICKRVGEKRWLYARYWMTVCLFVCLKKGGRNLTHLKLWGSREKKEWEDERIPKGGHADDTKIWGSERMSLTFWGNTIPT